MKEKGTLLLRQMLGPQARFRPGQWEAIEKLAIKQQWVSESGSDPPLGVAGSSTEDVGDGITSAAVTPLLGHQ